MSKLGKGGACCQANEKKLEDVSCLRLFRRRRTPGRCPSMTSLANIDPSLRDMSYAVNLTTNLSTSQDGHGADGNSILGGEPVRRSGFVPQP